jgi:hypothetical protein
MAKKKQTKLTGNAPLGIVVPFNPERHTVLIASLARQGCTNAEIAAHCGIDIRSLGVWRSKFEAVETAITESRAYAVARLESAMLEAAMGGEYDEKTKVKRENEDGSISYEYKTTTKLTKASVTAQMFLLKNLAPDRYKDRHEIKQTGELNITWNEVREELTAEARAAIKAPPAIVLDIVKGDEHDERR